MMLSRVNFKKATSFSLMFLAVLFFISANSCNNESKQAAKHYDGAKTYLQAGDLENALNEINKALSIENTNPQFLYLKAFILNASMDYSGSINILNKLVEQNYHLDTVYFHIGQNHFDIGSHYREKVGSEDLAKTSYEECIAYYSRALDINPMYYNAYIGKQRALHNIGKYEEALITLNTASNLFKDSLSLICYRGVEKLSLGDVNGALYDLTNSINSSKIDSADKSIAYRFRGNLLSQQKKYDDAIVDYTKALDLNPNNTLCYANRADCYYSLGLYDLACIDLRKAADLGFVNLYEEIKEICN